MRTPRPPEEEGVIRKPWGNKLTVCLAYPNGYETGMSNLGFQTVYRLFNEHPQVVCERMFLPDRGSGPPRSIESGRPARDFHVLAFSLPFENDYPHVLELLSMSRLNTSVAERREQEPLIMAGGIAVTLNPEPLADFVDLFLLGEGEEIIPAFIEKYLAAYTSRDSKQELLITVQRCVPGAYVPALYEVKYASTGEIVAFQPRDRGFPERVVRGWVKDLDRYPCEQVITAPSAALGSMYLVEVNRGCSRGCRFCAAGYVYRPVRFRSKETLQRGVDRGVKKVGRIGLMGTAVSDHPHLTDLIRYTVTHGGEVAVSSLRLDRLTEEMISLLVLGGVKTVALAPEAGSQRLRDVIKKGITEEYIIRAFSLLLEAGIEHFRLYTMVGLPTEGESDITALIELIQKICAVTGSRQGVDKRARTITVSVNPFVPKPATPFQWEPMAMGRYITRQIKRIKTVLGQRATVKVRAESFRQSYLQALFSLGDRRVGSLLARHHAGDDWVTIFRRAEIHPDFWVHRRKDGEELLPWDFIDHGMAKEILIREYRAVGGQSNPY